MQFSVRHLDPSNTGLPQVDKLTCHEVTEPEYNLTLNVGKVHLRGKKLH